MNKCEYLMQAIQIYAYKNRLMPTLITMHPAYAEILQEEFQATFRISRDTSTDKFQFRGIKVFRSLDVKEGEIILSTDLQNYNNIH